MAVYTEVSAKDATALFGQLKLGTITAMQGCPGGIENTNYFVTAELNGQISEFVLTLFERLNAEQLPFYLRLMKHLALGGIPVPDPVANRDGDLVHALQGKPAAIVNRLPGKSVMSPGAEHCAALGAMLARMHLAGADLRLSQPNLRGLAWWNQTVPVVLPHLDTGQTTLIGTELAYQNHIAASSAYQALPQGPIHADLFRDNALFEVIDGQARLSGCFDFYFAGVDTWLFDIAVCLNDWCIDHDSGEASAERSRSLLSAYAGVRPLTAAERQLLPAMLRAAALRFWLSRLWDCHLPRDASLLTAHDPAPLERVLRLRAGRPVTEMLAPA